MKDLYKVNKFYQKGSPILVNGFLQKSFNDQDQQVKLKKIAVDFTNILPSEIEALEMKIVCMNSFNTVINKVQFDYFEMGIKPGTTYGKDIFFEVPQKSTNYKAIVTRYKIGDEIKEIENQLLESYSIDYLLPNLIEFKSLFYKEQLKGTQKVLRDLYNDGNLIFCFCNKINHQLNKKCYHCGIAFYEDMTIDDDTIHNYMKTKSKELKKTLKTDLEIFSMKENEFQLWIKKQELKPFIEKLKKDKRTILESSNQVTFSYMKKYENSSFDLVTKINELLSKSEKYEQINTYKKLDRLTFDEMLKELKKTNKDILQGNKEYQFIMKIKEDLKIKSLIDFSVIIRSKIKNQISKSTPKPDPFFDSKIYKDLYKLSYLEKPSLDVNHAHLKSLIFAYKTSINVYRTKIKRNRIFHFLLFIISIPFTLLFIKPMLYISSDDLEPNNLKKPIGNKIKYRLEQDFADTLIPFIVNIIILLFFYFLIYLVYNFDYLALVNYNQSRFITFMGLFTFKATLTNILQLKSILIGLILIVKMLSQKFSYLVFEYFNLVWSDLETNLFPRWFLNKKIKGD